MLCDVKNKVSIIQLAEPPEIPVYEITIRKRVAKTVAPKAKLEKRDNVFSKSRDNREDRGTREIKTSHKVQTFSRSR
jgi:hypothetical protein